MRNFILGLIAGLALSATTANAGIISHVIAYQMGKSDGKEEAKPIPCPNIEKPKDN